MTVKVVLVDDHTVVRSGLRRLLESHKSIEIVAEADTGEAAYQVYGEILPDVMLMDISMPGMGGLVATNRTLQRNSDSKIVIFYMH